MPWFQVTLGTSLSIFTPSSTIAAC
jgi:hypothetical protein